MDIVIKLRYLKKLEIYQEIRHRDKHDSYEWRSEKAILAFAVDPIRHTNRLEPLPAGFFASQREDFGNPGVDGGVRYYSDRLANLISYGYAKEAENIENGIIVIQDGFIAGEVITELQQHPLMAKLKYCFSHLFAWVIFFASAFLIIANAVKLVTGGSL